MPRKKTPTESQITSPVTENISRNIKCLDSTILYVRAGGRCEFDGCNQYLLEHPLTKREGNYGQKAHIVAFRRKGSRGDDAGRPKEIHSLDNLMLLCPICHKEIDDNPNVYSVETLQRHKFDHENRIFWHTELKPERQTYILILKAKIGGQHVSIPVGDVYDAIAPNYPVDRSGCVIDLQAFDDESPDFLRLARHQITTQVRGLYKNGLGKPSVSHISVFALAPMPLLIFLGSQLSNKIQSDLYQRHRDNNEKWIWKNHGEPVNYHFHQIQLGEDQKKVALICSLSAKIGLEKLPPEIDSTFTIYELTLKNLTPQPTFLNLKEDLDRFRISYQTALREIENRHGLLTELHFFPAVPAPVAILCGRELMPKVDPSLIVYDNDKRLNGFKRIFEVHPLPF